MKSGKQRKAEIKKARLERIKKSSGLVDPVNGPIPDWALLVDPNQVVYSSTFFDIPLFYLDKEFKCKDCGTYEIWTAKQQKWWYEVAKGDLETTAVRCRACRDARKSKRDAQKKHMKTMAEKEPHPNEKFFKNT